MLDRLTLADYASKYRVSVSTLRRRIKKNDIQYVFENGKYFLQDQSLSSIINSKESFSSAPPKKKASVTGHDFDEKDFLEDSKNQAWVETLQGNLDFKDEISGLNDQFGKDKDSDSSNSSDLEDTPPQFEQFNIHTILAPLLDQMNKELKKAYSATLQEKEKQIIILKEQVVDLKTLVNVLEDENKRLSGNQKRMSYTPSPRF